MEKRYFLVFPKHDDLEARFARLGMTRNDQGPCLWVDEDPWCEIEPADYYHDGFFMYERQPALPVERVWELFVHSRDEGNRMGAISQILNHEPHDDILAHWAALRSQSPSGRAVRRALKTLETLYVFQFGERKRP